MFLFYFGNNNVLHFIVVVFRILDMISCIYATLLPEKIKICTLFCHSQLGYANYDMYTLTVTHN